MYFSHILNTSTLQSRIGLLFLVLLCLAVFAASITLLFFFGRFVVDLLFLAGSGILIFTLKLALSLWIDPFIDRSLSYLLREQKNTQLPQSSNADYEGAIKRLSVTSLFIRDRFRRNVITYVLLGSALAAGASEHGFSLSELSFDILVLTYALILLIDELLLAYRVRRGFYANNEYEARELIAYILQNSDKLDDDDGHRRIFDPAESETTLVEKIIPFGLEA